ncbi:MAG TPA: hypothetical protein VFN52_04600 [Acidiferrobacteraceae bacterium]|nr:hypothetical protein [Acidiferrobacteraceae bacterium]
MKARDVPQDESVLAGLRRACYAEDEQGHYVVVPSRGWEVERMVNEHAHEALRQQLREILQAARTGLASPLAYYMTWRQMDINLLAANAGIARWRVRWHLRPRVFRKLPHRLLQRYASALDVDPLTLTRLPEETP